MKKRNSLVLLFLLSAFNIFAQGNLLIAPTRIVFKDRQQKTNLNINNIGKDTAVYLISFINYQMLADGSFKQLKNSDSITNRADKYLRIFPRKVNLPPGESQVLKLQFRKPLGMKDGEYRSHLYFRADKNVSPLGMKDQDSDSTHLKIQLTPIFGISIPVIIRTGQLDLSLKLSDTNLTAVNDSIYYLNLSINRSGEESSYGSLKIDFIPNKGKTVEVGLSNGVGIYTELDKRNFSMILRTKENIKLENGKLLIRYISPREDGNKELAHINYLLPTN